MEKLIQDEMVYRLLVFADKLDYWEEKEAEAFRKYDEAYKETRKAFSDLRNGLNNVIETTL